MRPWCFACVVAAWCCVAAAGDCDVTIGDRTYREETLLSSVWWPGGLAFNLNTHYLYFHFYNGSWNNAKVDVKGKVVSVIEELREPCAFAVDQARGAVHAGCRDLHGGGLHTWDSNTGQFELAGEAGREISFVHYNNNALYYSAYPELLLHTFTRGHSARVSALASPLWHFVLDAQGNYIFTNLTGVYRRRGNGEEVRFAEFERWVYDLAVDGRGAAYACESEFSRGIWRLPDRAPATRLLDVACNGLTFDADGNIIYADASRRSIVHLVPC